MEEMLRFPNLGALGLDHTQDTAPQWLSGLLCVRVPLGDKCLMPDFLKHFPLRSAQKRMLWVKFTRLGNLRKYEDLGQSK